MPLEIPKEGDISAGRGLSLPTLSCPLNILSLSFVLALGLHSVCQTKLTGSSANVAQDVQEPRYSNMLAVQYISSTLPLLLPSLASLSHEVTSRLHLISSRVHRSPSSSRILNLMLHILHLWLLLKPLRVTRLRSTPLRLSLHIHSRRLVCLQLVRDIGFFRRLGRFRCVPVLDMSFGVVGFDGWCFVSFEFAQVEVLDEVGWVGGGGVSLT